jgi:hypothetical protein
LLSQPQIPAVVEFSHTPTGETAMETGLTQFGEMLAEFLSSYSSLTIVGGSVFVVAFFGWLISRWPECLAVFLCALGYAILPFLSR